MMLKQCVLASSVLLCFGSVHAQTMQMEPQAPVMQQQPAPTAPGMQPQAPTARTPQQTADMRDSAAEADKWLRLIDEGRYGESWDAASNIFRFTIKRDEWIKAQDKLRKPFGNLNSRQLIEQKPAENPKGLPAGDYMVLAYKSSFAAHPVANELVTMVRSTDGKWKVLTYHASY